LLAQQWVRTPRNEANDRLSWADSRPRPLPRESTYLPIRRGIPTWQRRGSFDPPYLRVPPQPAWARVVPGPIFPDLPCLLVLLPLPRALARPGIAREVARCGHEALSVGTGSDTVLRHVNERWAQDGSRSASGGCPFDRGFHFWSPWPAVIVCLCLGEHPPMWIRRLTSLPPRRKIGRRSCTQA
jgi:hypothetical protein